MTKMRTIATLAVTLALTASVGLTAAHAKKSCVLAGGEATMATQDLAKFMANAALENSIKGKALKASGAVKMTCKEPSPLTYCLAQQKACK